MSKHEAIMAWLADYMNTDEFESGGLRFENVTMTQGFRSVVPNAGDNFIKEDVTGNKLKEYVFAFIICESFDSEGYDYNLAAMDIGDNFNLWIEEQKEAKTYPDFGDNTYKYKLDALSNMADLAAVENEVAKYMLGVRIQYWES